MKTAQSIPPSGKRSSAAVRREKLLAEFDRSGLSGAAFARMQKINYSTFCAWRYQRSKSNHITFAQVEVTTPAPPDPLVIELGLHAKLRLSSSAQFELAARFLHHLQSVC